MWTVTNLLLCSFVAVIAQANVILEPDRPFLRVPINAEATLECCYKSTLKTHTLTWFRSENKAKLGKLGKSETLKKTVQLDTIVAQGRGEQKENSGIFCGSLTLESVQLENTGIYSCWLNESKLYTYGTYLQVYKPLVKTINLSESTKNKILTAEGILLFLCVILPASTLLFQSKRLNELEKKKVRKEEENIYQGLNLDDCCATYDQIERSQAPSQYEDVCNTIEEEEEEIQLEKP